MTKTNGVMKLDPDQVIYSHLIQELALLACKLGSRKGNPEVKLAMNFDKVQFYGGIQQLGILKKLKKGVSTSPKKCCFLCKKVSDLGHIISNCGVSPDPKKLDKVKCFPVPRDVTQLRQFLGLVGYYRCFVPQLARIAVPIHGLLKKENAFCLDARVQDSL